MYGLLASLPMHLACQLITGGNDTLGGPVNNMAMPHGYTAFPDIGMAYKYYNNGLSWNMARKHCISEGGSLAIIDSFKKVEYANIVRGAYERGPWIGIHKSFDGTEWVSLKTGLPLTFIPWSPDVKILDDQHCAYLEKKGVAAGSNCKGSWSYLCEIPIGKQPLNTSCNIPDAPAGLEAN